MIEDNMEKAIAHLGKEFRMIRTGRATPALVENIRVNAYGSEMLLKQCGTISVPEARQLMIKPFDPGILKDVEKALLASDLGVTPQNDGKLLRLSFPPPTEERRKKLAKEVKAKGEDGKISIRNSRRDGLKDLETLQKGKVITEDDLKKLKDDVQELVKKYEKSVDAEVERKSAEIMEI
jgi:ribosome recycling factor